MNHGGAASPTEPNLRRRVSPHRALPELHSTDAVLRAAPTSSRQPSLDGPSRGAAMRAVAARRLFIALPLTLLASASRPRLDGVRVRREAPRIDPPPFSLNQTAALSLKPLWIAPRLGGSRPLASAEGPALPIPTGDEPPNVDVSPGFPSGPPGKIVVGKDEFPRRAILIDPDPNRMVDTGPYVQLLRPPWVYVLFSFIIWMHMVISCNCISHCIGLTLELIMDILKLLGALFPLFSRLCPCCGGGGRGGDNGRAKENPMTAAAASIQRTVQSSAGGLGGPKQLLTTRLWSLD